MVIEDWECPIDFSNKKIQVLVVFKQFEVNESKDDEFKAALKTYCADFSAEDDCLQ